MEASEQRDGGWDDEQEVTHEQESLSRTRAEALINAINQYQVAYPALQRGIQFLFQELSEQIAAGDNDDDITRCVRSFIKMTALRNTVHAMQANFDSPAFINSCFELLSLMLDASEEVMAAALRNTDIWTVLDKIVHNVIYQDESACVQRGIHILSKVVASLTTIENNLWLQLVATTAQAMLTSSQDDTLLLECVLSLKHLFQLRTDVAVPVTSANAILKTLDQSNEQRTGVSGAFALAAIPIVFRILDTAPESLCNPNIGISAPILAAQLHHYQLSVGLDNTHKCRVEKIVQGPLQTAVHNALTQLIDLALSPTESYSETQLASFHSAAMTLVLGLVWKEEARAFLNSGGIAVLANIFASGAALSYTTIETALAQSLFYVSMHCSDETWNEIQVNISGIGKLVELINERCNDGNDRLVHYFLAMVNTLLPCEGFREAFTKSNGAVVFQTVLHKRQQLPICAHSVIAMIAAVPLVCPPDSLPVICSLVAETMFSLETNRLCQSECTLALTALMSEKCDGTALLSTQNIQDIVRVMRSKLASRSFTGDILNLVVNAMLNNSMRASFIDRGILQVVCKAICTHQWDMEELAGTHAQWIISDVAHKLDVSRSLSTLEPHARISSDFAFNPQAISNEALDTCCCMVGSLSSVKSLFPQLLEEKGIEYIVGMLRYAKQELIMRSESSFIQLVTTCFYALRSIVNSPVVRRHVAEVMAVDGTIDETAVLSRLIDSGAADATIGGLEEALRVKTTPPLLVDSGCLLLQAILVFRLPLSTETESRWIAVATSLLQRDSTLQRTRGLLFGTTLSVLAQRQSTETARGQHIKMMKVILEGLSDSIQDESSCTLLQTEGLGAVRVLQELSKATDNLSDTMISRCLGVLGQLIGIFILSPSTIAQESLTIFDNAIGFFATPSYVNRLVCRLEKCLTRGTINSATMVTMADDFKALEAILFSSRARRTIDAHHHLFGQLAAVAENQNANTEMFGEHMPFFLELGCLSSQLLSTAHREEVVNAVLCHFAEEITWHSMRWIAALDNRCSSEFTLIVEFVLLRIVSGYTILDPALLMELLDALNYLLRCTQCQEIVIMSSHFTKFREVLRETVLSDLAHMETEPSGYDVAISVLGIISVLLSTGDIFPIYGEDNANNILVRFCLETLDNCFLKASGGMTKIVLLEEVLLSTSIILQHCIRIGAEHIRFIIKHRATHYVVNMCTDAASAIERKHYQKWYLVVLKTAIQCHGLLYAEKLLNLSSDPSTLLISLVEIAHENDFSWKCLMNCVTVVDDSIDINKCQTNFCALFENLQQQSMSLIHVQATVINSRGVEKHIATSITHLSLKYAQLCLETAQNETDCCLQTIAQSGLSFYELFSSASSFGVCEYSVIVSLHLKIARVAAMKANTDRSISDESAITLFKQLLDPICISDQALADYVDLTAILCLPPSTRPAAWLFVESSADILLTCTKRLKTGPVRSPCLEKSLLNCFASLRSAYTNRWEGGEVDNVLELVRICFSDKWVLDHILESVLALPEGLLHLFELARVAASNNIQVIIMTFLFQHVDEIRHKTQRIGERELSAILSMVKRNLAGKVGEICRRSCLEVTGGKMLQISLGTLKLFARRKNYATLCAQLGGIDTLYNVLCAPSQFQDCLHLALEICCCLAGYGVDLAHENTVFALQLLFVFVETHGNNSRSRLAYLVLEFVLAVGPPALSLTLIHHCRTKIVPASSRSYEETEMFIQQLYITRQKLTCYASKTKCASTVRENTDDSLTHRCPMDESEILGIISSSYRNIVECSSEDEASSYINVNTSEKSAVEPPAYSRLKNAIAQLGLVLDDIDMAMNRGYVSDLVPALCEIIVLHTVTTPMICNVMQALDQIAFINPSTLMLDKQVDFQALFASCSLHQRRSLQFTRHLARFCNSLVADFQDFSEDEAELLRGILPLLLELLQTWTSDLKIVDQCFATIHEVVHVMPLEQVEHCGSLAVLTLLNSAVLPYIGNFSTSWNWLKSIVAVVRTLDKPAVEPIQDVITTVLSIIRMFMSHNSMVEKALQVLLIGFKEKRRLRLQYLTESEGVKVLLTCLKLHPNDNSIARTCLELLLALISQNDSSIKTIERLLVAAAEVPILLVCKKDPHNPKLCKMCIDLVRGMVESFASHQAKMDEISASLTDSKKKLELLTNLLEVEAIPLLFDLLDNHSRIGNNLVIGSSLALLKSLTKDERLRESAEVLHGLQELQQIIDRVWENKFDPDLIELAIDCLVNMACSDRAISPGWRSLPMWLMQLALSIHELKTSSSGMCVEKLIGILGRLTVDPAICKAIIPKGTFVALELLNQVGADRSLEQALYGLLCTLCEDTTSAQILIVYDAIPITAGRIACVIDDEETLLANLCFFDLLVPNSGESYPALLEKCVYEALGLVIQEYPEISWSQMHRTASTILEKVSALDSQSPRTKPTPAKSTKPVLTQLSEPGNPFQDLLLEGASFRILWEARPESVEIMQVKLAPSGDYLLFQRKATSHLPRIERVFVSQLEVCPQRSFIDQFKISTSTSKKILAQSLRRENFEGDRVLRLKIRDEDVLIKTDSTRERVYWDQALQWLTSHRHARALISPIHSP